MGVLNGMVALVTARPAGGEWAAAWRWRSRRRGEYRGHRHRPAEPRRARRKRRLAGLDSVVEEVERLGRKAIGLELDVRKETAVRAVVDETLRAFGRIDIVVNNAAAPQEPSVKFGWEITEEEWNTQFAVNLTGAFLVCRNVIPHMVERGSGVHHQHVVGGRQASPAAATRVQRDQARHHRPHPLVSPPSSPRAA
jgi:NAD(P)-dependent dehydrogenase (short-subunit alcohol dehydrogenase family)